MFSNGTEYESFLSCQCRGCPHFVYWEEATADRPECDIEARIAVANPGTFPFEWLDSNENMHRYDCRKKAGLGPKCRHGKGMDERCQECQNVIRGTGPRNYRQG